MTLILPAGAQDSVTLQLKWTHAFQFAGYYAAKEKGYYHEAGLEVEILEANPATNPVEEVLSGNAEYGVGTSSLLLYRAAGKPVVVMAVIFQQSPYEIYAASDIHSLKDLIGKRLMIEPQSDELLAFLKKEGIPVDSIHQIPHSFNPDGLMNGDAEAMSGYISNEPYYFRQAGFSYQTFSPRAAGIDFYGDNLFTSESELNQHPERVRAFRDASIKGWQYAKDHPAEIIELIIANYSGQHTREYLEFESDQMIPLLQPDLIEIGYMNPKRWQHIANTYSGIGLLPADYSLEGFIYKPNENDHTFLTRTLGILVLVVVFTSLLTYYIYRVNRRLAASIAKATQVTDALEKSEDLWRTIVKASPDGMAITSPEGIIEQVSDKCVLMLGYNSSAEIIGKNFYEFIDPKFYKLANSRLQDVFEARFSGASEYLVTRKDGSQFFIESNVSMLRDKDGNISRLIHNVRDIDQRRQMSEAIEKRIVALTLPIAEETSISFEGLFNLSDIQQIQDDFASATGVASLITRPDGTPITRPSNFTRFCKAIVRQTEKGCMNCRNSDYALGLPDSTGPKLQLCHSGGLWDAGAAITVNGQHIANWLVGQVRDENQTEVSIRAYAKEIGTDEEELLAAFYEVPSMSEARFTKVAQSLYTLANQLSVSAYQNVQQARYIAELKAADDALKISESRFRALFTQMSEGFALHEIVFDAQHKAIDYRIIDANPSFEKHLGISADQAKGMLASQFYGVDPAPYLDTYADIAVNGGHQTFQTFFPPLDKHFEISAFSPNPGFFATVFADISERKLAEKVLSESEERYRLLVENNLDAFLLTRPDGSIHRINQATCRIFQMTEEEIYKAGRNGLIDTTDPRLADALEERERTGKFVGELTCIRKDGSSFPVDISTTVFNGHDGYQYTSMIIRDITDRKRAEVELRETRDYLENLLNYANAPIIVWDHNYKITQFNKAFERLTGLTADEVHGSEVSVLFPESTKEKSLGYIHKASSGDRWEVVEIDIKHIDGSIRTLLWNSAVIYSSDGNSIVATIAQGQDITERKEAEADLRETRDYLENLLNYANAPIIVWDHNYKITQFNKAFERLTGLSAAEVFGQEVSVLFPESTKEKSLGYIQQASSGDRWEVVEIDIKHIDGSIHTLLWNSAVIYSSDGNSIVATIAQGQDITERKEAEADLRETRDYLENLLNYANAPIIVWDHNYKITQFNKAFERLTGQSAAEVFGQEVSVLFPESTKEKSLGYIHQASSGDRWEVVEIDIKHIDGSIRTLLWNSAVISSSEGNSIVATIAQGQDITERKQAEFKLKNSEERFRLLLNSSAEGIYGVDNDGNCTFCNQSALRMLGYGNIDEVLGKNMHDLIHHSHSDGSPFKVDDCQIFKAFLEGRETHAEDEVFWTKPGESFPAEYWSYPIYSEGSIIGSVVTFFDVSERKKAAQALFDSERQKATLISNLPGFVYRCFNDKDWTIQYISDGCKAITGYEPADFLQNNKISFNDIMMPEYREPIWQSWQNLLKEKKPFTGEYPIMNASGETRWVWEQGQGIFADDGTLLYLEGFITDITGQKVIQEAIRESQEKLSTIIATSPDGIAITSLDGTIQSVSPQIVAMWQLDSADEMIGRNAMEFLHPDYQSKAVYYITEMLNGNLTGANEYLMIRKDGSSFFVEANANILRDSANEPIGILYIERDITERKIAEQILKESEEQHRLLFETAREGIFVAQGDKLSYFNPMIPEITGYSREELTELNFIDLVYTDDRELVQTNYKKRLKGEFEDQRYSFRILRKDNSFRWAEISGVKIDWKGEPATLNFINDIHDHKLAEEALRENENRLRELNATKDKFFSIIAHDLKSPFNNILALSNLLVDQINNNEKEGMEEYAGLIQHSSQRAMDLLLNLLEWSRSQTGRMEFSPEYVELTTMINEVTDLANDTAMVKSISIVKRLPHNALVMADKAMLGAVLRNLLSNAIKFTRPGGAIEIEVKALKKETLVIVSDNGIGIKSEALKKLFRIEESITTKGTKNETGTGLGLLLCKEFVHKHGGEIWVESEFGKGSKFYFTIPKN